MAGHLQIGAFTSTSYWTHGWVSSYQKKAIKSAKSKFDFLNRRPIYLRDLQGKRDFTQFSLHGRDMIKLSDDYLPEDMRGKNNLAVGMRGVFVGNRDVCGGVADIEIHYNTHTLTGYVYLVA